MVRLKNSRALFVLLYSEVNIIVASGIVIICVNPIPFIRPYFPGIKVVALLRFWQFVGCFRVFHASSMILYNYRRPLMQLGTALNFEIDSLIFHDF